MKLRSIIKIGDPIKSNNVVKLFARSLLHFRIQHHSNDEVSQSCDGLEIKPSADRTNSLRCKTSYSVGASYSCHGKDLLITNIEDGTYHCK